MSSAADSVSLFSSSLALSRSLQKNPFHGFFYEHFTIFLARSAKKNSKKEKTDLEKFAKWINVTWESRNSFITAGKINQNPFWIISQVKVHWNFPGRKKTERNTRKIHQMVLSCLEVRIFHADLENSCYSKNHYFSPLSTMKFMLLMWSLRRIIFGFNGS